MSQLRGDKEMINALSQLEVNVATKLLRRSLRAGAKVIAAGMQGDAPEGGGDDPHAGRTKAAIKVRAGKRSRNKISMVAGVFGSAFKGLFYAGFVALGRKPKGRSARIPGTNWAKKSFNHNAERAMDAGAEQMRTDLAEEIAAARTVRT
jgi:hypothetical protein